MDKAKENEAILKEKLRFAQRASTLIKTPQFRELQKIIMDEMSKYNNDITSGKPLSYEEYLLALGKLRGLNNLLSLIINSANRKDEYAEQLERYRS